MRIPLRNQALVLLAAAVFLTPAQASIVFSNLSGPGNLYGPDPLGVGAIPAPGIFLYQATNFTPGVSAALTTIELPITVAQGPPELDIFLMADSGNLPGAVVEQFHLTGLLPAPPGGIPLLSVPSVTHPVLASGKQYWVAATGGTPSTFAMWSLILFAGDPGAGGATRSIQNGVDTGWALNGGTRQTALRVNGDPLTGVPEVSTVFIVGSGLVAFGLLRRRR